MTLRWIFAVLVGAGLSAAVAVLAWFLTPDAPAVGAAAFGACTLLPALALGWIIFVAPVSVPKQGPSEDDVESRWLDRALSGTAVDLVVVMSIALSAVSVTGTNPPAQLLLIFLILVALGSATLRYAAQRRRTLTA